ncbi:uncharacterized protein EDB91DRAFT_117586 [Suillus paluster]|uniref:uncharacterized protein n=1 Tax=Suillus paluster TaxID=48578 RepID=UPI001B877D83|nr:uncharacterized protein EDB91DRAFT_117586 [Suillus paluster]KAG1725006.1 hypothetical protein EDB91DRAFT_117586 [Suillus paluster]
MISRVYINICCTLHIATLLSVTAHLPAHLSAPQYSPAMPSSKYNQLHDARTTVYIDILPESSSLRSPFSSRSRTSSSSLYKSPQVVTAFHPSSNTPCRMRDIDSTVTFASPSVVIAKSSYIIILDGAPIHSEDTKLECIGPRFAGSMNPSNDGTLLYRTALVPKYWEILCKSPDPTIYSIIQDVYCPPDPASPRRSSSRPRPVLIFSATYHFRYPVPVCTPPSSIPPCLTYQSNPPFIANSAHAYSDSFESICPQNYPIFSSLSDQESPQSHEDSTQNQLYEHFVLNVSPGNLSLHDSTINIHDSLVATYPSTMAQSSFSSFPKDIRNYIM